MLKKHVSLEKIQAITDPSDGIYDDGEWISWDFINSYLDGNDGWSSDDRFSNIDEESSPSTLQLWGILAELVETAKNYIDVTGRHLPIYGELGELYGEIKYGIRRHKQNAEGSDGKIGNDFIEIKTISPLKTNNTVQVKRSGHFNKLLIVKISEGFEFQSMMIDRKDLRKGVGKYAKASLDKQCYQLTSQL